MLKLSQSRIEVRFVANKYAILMMRNACGRSFVCKAVTVKSIMEAVLQFGKFLE